MLLCFKVTCRTFQVKRQRTKVFRCIFNILFPSQYTSLLNGAVSGRGKGWFLMDLSAKALFGNLNYQMLQLHTARCCHVQDKHIPEITILHIQKEHYNHCLSPQPAPLYSPHTAVPMSNLSLNFRAIYSYEPHVI